MAGRGKREPLIRTSDGAPEPRNRRVEVTVR
jgi:outer membrane protein OmpA-like peptidoglycan-associated protein